MTALIFAGLRSFFGNWKVLLITLLLAIAGLVALKIRHTENQLTKEQAANATLQADYTQAQAANAQNELVIKQLQQDKQQALDALSKLSDDIQATRTDINAVRTKVNKLSVAPTKLPPYLIEAINGIQASSAASQPRNPK